MKTFLNKARRFFQELYFEKRLPERDKKLVLGILLLLSLRILFIPDWLPYFSKLDVLFLMGVVSDYVFNVIDQNLILSHYPWGMKSFARLRRIGQFLGLFAPNFICHHLWLYVKEPF